MTPSMSKVMEGFCGTMLAEIVPRLDAIYAAGSASLMGLMLYMCASECERAAAVRVEENADMRALFAKAEKVIDDAGLKVRLAEAAGSVDPSLMLSDLDRANAELKRLLIELHAYVEENREAWARRLEDRIWAFLVRSADQRKIEFPVLG